VNDTIISWELLSEDGILTSTISRYKKAQHHSQEHNELIAIRSALTMITTAHEVHNATPKPNTIVIWTNTKKIFKNLVQSTYKDATIYTSVQDNAEHINAITIMLRTHQQHIIKEYNEQAIVSAKESTKRQDKKVKSNAPLKLKETKEITFVQLNINNTYVGVNLQHELRQASTDQEYFNYIKEKYNWNQKTIDDIDWEALKLAIRNSPFGKRKTLSQLLHGWLPTRGHPGTKATNEDRTFCPICKQTTETNQHFLTCAHEREKWAEKYEKAAIKIGTGDELELTIIAVIKATMQNQTNVPIVEKYKHIVQAQQSIGYNQLILGRYTKEWAEQYNKENESTDGIEWVSKHITLIWKNVKERWETRCTLAHEETEENKNEMNEAANKQLERQYLQFDNLDEIDKNILNKPLEEMLMLTLPTKVSWLKRNKSIIKTGLQRQKSGSKIKQNNIRNFFIPTTRNAQVQVIAAQATTISVSSTGTGREEQNQDTISTSTCTSTGKNTKNTLVHDDRRPRLRIRRNAYTKVLLRNNPVTESTNSTYTRMGKNTKMAGRNAGTSTIPDSSVEACKRQREVSMGKSQASTSNIAQVRCILTSKPANDTKATENDGTTTSNKNDKNKEEKIATDMTARCRPKLRQQIFPSEYNPP
jgi:hypothetical protein